MSLILKVLDYVFIQNAPKLPFLGQVPNLFFKHFWSHVTMGSCSTLDCEDVEKISKISNV